MSVFSGHKKILCIYGPTASGKTDFAASLAHYIPIEIVNMDSAQLYTPLTIGTSKPDWKATTFKQHMFDCLDEPTVMTVHAYRTMALRIVEDIWSRNKIPVFVGGSGFYLKTLLFPVQDAYPEEFNVASNAVGQDADLWNQLNAIDPVRAQAIHQRDVYRLRRALNIWCATGKKPSDMQPVYGPIAPYVLIKITCDREMLYARINERTYAMLNNGWLDEVRALVGTPWESFVTSKGFIGYAELINYIKQHTDLESATATIQRKTRNYAKRQEIFWRMLQKKLLNMAQNDTLSMKQIVEIDLTSANLNLYIKQLLDSLL